MVGFTQKDTALLTVEAKSDTGFVMIFTRQSSTYEGDPAGARDAFQHSIDSGLAEWPAVARVDLARIILVESDNVDEAETLLNDALAIGSTAVAASARLLLGLIALYRGDRELAREEFTSAADGPAQVAQPALMQIAKMAMVPSG